MHTCFQAWFRTISLRTSSEQFSVLLIRSVIEIAYNVISFLNQPSVLFNSYFFCSASNKLHFADTRRDIEI